MLPHTQASTVIDECNLSALTLAPRGKNGVPAFFEGAPLCVADHSGLFRYGMLSVALQAPPLVVMVTKCGLATGPTVCEVG